MGLSRSKHVPAFQLSAYPPATLPQPMWEARAKLESSAAAIVDIRKYSDKLVVFQLNLRLADWPTFVEYLLRSGLGVEAPNLGPTPQHANQDGDVFGTLSVSLRSAREEIRDIVPAVPG